MKTMEIELFSAAFFVSQSGYSKFYEYPEKAAGKYEFIRLYEGFKFY